MKRYLVMISLFLFLVSPGIVSAAIEYAGTPSGGSWYYSGTGGSVGTEFTSSVSTSVIRLGIFDYNGDGLNASHEVGLYDVNTSSWIASLTIPAGSVAPIKNGYRWMNATAPIVAGHNYIVAAAYHDGGADWFVDTAQINAPFTLLNNLYIDNATGLDLPTQTYFNDGRGWFGPNVEVAIPEPATILIWSMLGAAWMGGLTIVRRRRSHGWAPEARTAIFEIIESGRK